MSYGGLEKYPGGLDTQMGQIEPVEIRLKLRLKEKLAEVDALNKAIELLEKQPQLLETLNILRKVGV